MKTILKSPISSLFLDQVMVSRGNLVCVPKTATIEDVLKVLADKHIQCVPVEDTDHPGTLIGLLDVNDVVHTLIRYCKDLNSIGTEKFLSQPVHEFIGRSAPSVDFTLSEDMLAEKLAQRFASGTHHMFIRSVKGEIAGVGTQFDFVRFLEKHLDRVNVAQKTVKELGMVQEWVFFVRKSERALTAFQKLSENNVSALAVEDVEGRFVGFLSASDLSGLNRDTFKRLALPCLDFQTAQRGCPSRSCPSTSPQGGKRELQVCKETDTFTKVLKQMVEHALHRMWVVDDAGKAIGVISLTDLCKAVMDGL